MTWRLKTVELRVIDEGENLMRGTGGRGTGDGFSDLKVQSVAVQSCFTEKLSQ